MCARGAAADPAADPANVPGMQFFHRYYIPSSIDFNKRRRKKLCCRSKKASILVIDIIVDDQAHDGVYRMAVAGRDAEVKAVRILGKGNGQVIHRDAGKHLLLQGWGRLRS